MRAVRIVYLPRCGSITFLGEPGMYLRFVLAATNPRTGQRAGLFHVAYRLQEAGTLSSTDQSELDALLRWFNHHLRRPTQFGRARFPHGVSWIRADAHAHVQRLQLLAALLRRHDLGVEMLRTDRPGFLVYQDDVQAIAEPFAATPR